MKNRIEWVGMDEWNEKVTVMYENGTKRKHNSASLPKTVSGWMEKNEPKMWKEIEMKNHPFGLVACMDSVAFHVESLGENPFEMLKGYEERAKKDICFNKRMIEAVQKYIEENGITEEESEDEEMKMNRNTYNSMSEFEAYKDELMEQWADSTEMNTVDVVIDERTKSGTWMCIDLITECKRPMTAIRRMFSVLTDEEIDRLGWTRESVEELVENGCFSLFEEQEYSFSLEEIADGEWYIYLNVCVERKTPEINKTVEVGSKYISLEDEGTALVLDDGIQYKIGVADLTAEERSALGIEAETATPETKEEPQKEDTRSDLQKQCEGVVEWLQAVSDGELIVDDNGEADGIYFDVLYSGDTVTMWDWFQSNDVYDVEYHVGSDGDFRGVRLMVACGGPNIYINTSRGEVEGYWWTDSAFAWIPREICDDINSVWEDLYAMTVLCR